MSDKPRKGWPIAERGAAIEASQENMDAKDRMNLLNLERIRRNNPANK